MYFEGFLTQLEVGRIQAVVDKHTVSQQRSNEKMKSDAIARIRTSMAPYTEGKRSITILADARTITAPRVAFGILPAVAQLNFWNDRFLGAVPTFFRHCKDLLDLPAPLRQPVASEYLGSLFAHVMIWLYTHIIAVEQKNGHVKEKYDSTIVRSVSLDSVEGIEMLSKLKGFNNMYNATKASRAQEQRHGISIHQVRLHLYNNPTRLNMTMPPAQLNAGGKGFNFAASSAVTGLGAGVEGGCLAALPAVSHARAHNYESADVSDTIRHLRIAFENALRRRADCRLQAFRPARPNLPSSAQRGDRVYKGLAVEKCLDRSSNRRQRIKSAL